MSVSEKRKNAIRKIVGDTLPGPYMQEEAINHMFNRIHDMIGGKDAGAAITLQRIKGVNYVHVMSGVGANPSCGCRSGSGSTPYRALQDFIARNPSYRGLGVVE